MRIYFNGCSLTHGEGVSESENYPSLIAAKHGVSVTNVGVLGDSNYNIYSRSINAVLSGQYDIIVTQWSALHRLWLYPGPDCKFSVTGGQPDFKYRDLYISPVAKKYLPIRYY